MRPTVAVDTDHDDGENNTPACNRDPAEDNSQQHGFAARVTEVVRTSL